MYTFERLRNGRTHVRTLRSSARSASGASANLRSGYLTRLFNSHSTAHSTRLPSSVRSTCVMCTSSADRRVYACAPHTSSKLNSEQPNHGPIHHTHYSLQQAADVLNYVEESSLKTRDSRVVTAMGGGATLQ